MTKAAGRTTRRFGVISGVRPILKFKNWSPSRNYPETPGGSPAALIVTRLFPDLCPGSLDEIIVAVHGLLHVLVELLQDVVGLRHARSLQVNRLGEALHRIVNLW